ncbi:MAG: RNA-binding protein [Patescibacteria group bacterium]|nr:RNA-binding protein [Patescibacteria group bacterium]
MEDKKKLFVGNLPWSIDDAKLNEMFAEFGEVAEAKVITDKFSGRSKGFAFVTFAKEEDAAKAVEALNEKDIDGRPLTVNVAKPMKPRD